MTSSPHPDPPAADDFVGIDVWRYLLHLLRHWYVVAGVTALGGAGGWLIAHSQTPVYVGTARLMVLNAGARPAQNALTTYRAMLETEAVFEAARTRLLQQGRAGSLTTADLRRSVSSRLAFPPDNFFVEARHGDAMVASYIADAVARAALDAARRIHIARLADIRAVLHEENEKADRALTAARQALADFRREHVKVLQAAAPPNVVTYRAELQYLASAIPAERARQAEVDEDLKNFPALQEREGKNLDAYYNDLLKRASESRSSLAAMESKRAQLAPMVQAGEAAAAEFRRQAWVVQREAELAADLNRAEKSRDLVYKANDEEEMNGIPVINTLEMIDTEPARGVSTINRAAGLPRGLAIGLVLSIFGVLASRGIRRE